MNPISIRAQRRLPRSAEALFVGRLMSSDDFDERLARALAHNDQFVQRLAVQGPAGFAAEARSSGFAQELAPIFATNRTCVFGVPHYGSYVSTFLQIGLASGGLDFVAIRGNLWSETETTMYSAVNSAGLCSIEIARTDRNGLVRFVRGLREGRHGLTCHDLFAGFGRTTPVNLFNRTFYLSFKWIEICWKARAAVCLVQPCSLDAPASLFEVIDPDRHVGLERFTEAVLKGVCASLERMLREAPWNWLMWHRLHHYATSDPLR